MRNWFKKLFIPSGEKTTVVAYNSWVVRWTSRKGDIYLFEIPEGEIFPSEEDANKFATQLREAFKLLKYKGRSLTKVTVESNQSTMANMPA